jgi:hypothetical protein
MQNILPIKADKFLAELTTISAAVIMHKWSEFCFVQPAPTVAQVQVNSKKKKRRKAFLFWYLRFRGDKFTPAEAGVR